MLFSQNASSPRSARNPARSWWKMEPYAQSAAPQRVPADAIILDCGNDALLPGLVDTHVHINQPGRTEWEGFRTATRAAAAGGYTTLVDMPLNCLPETTTVAALKEKRKSAQGECFVDWAPWGGAVADNQRTFCRWLVQVFSASSVSSSIQAATASP